MIKIFSELFGKNRSFWPQSFKGRWKRLYNEKKPPDLEMLLQVEAENVDASLKSCIRNEHNCFKLCPRGAFIDMSPNTVPNFSIFVFFFKYFQFCAIKFCQCLCNNFASFSATHVDFNTLT